MAQHVLFVHQLNMLCADPAIDKDPLWVVEFFQGWWPLHTLDHDRLLARRLVDKGLV